MKDVKITKNNIIKNTTKNYVLEEILSNNLLEGISKEQKEKDQREMAKRAYDPFFQLKKNLGNKWQNKGELTKEKILKKERNMEDFIIY